MGRWKRGGYLFEWWVGDHPPTHVHVHVYKNGKEVAKVEVPNCRVLKGNMSSSLKKVMGELLKRMKL